MGWGNMTSKLGANEATRLLLSKTALEHSHSYVPSFGFQKTREAFAYNFSQETGRELKPEDIFVTEGATHGMNVIINIMIRKRSDAGVFPELGYFPFRNEMVRRRGRIYAYRLSEDGQPDPGSLKYAIRQAKENGHCPRFIYINHPHNPTTAVYKPEIMKELLNIAQNENIPVIYDAVYYRLVSNRKAVHLTSPEIDEGRVLIMQLDSFSKKYGLCGERVGAIQFVNFRGTPEQNEIKSGISAILSDYLCANSNCQLAGVELLTNPAKYLVDLKLLRIRQDVFVQKFSENGLTIKVPHDATFYGFGSLSGKWDTEALAILLADKYNLAVTPGKSFEFVGEKPKSNENPKTEEKKQESTFRFALVPESEEIPVAAKIFGNALQDPEAIRLKSAP